MIELTSIQRSELLKRKAGFAAFRKERLPVLHKFAEIIGCPQPEGILLKPESYLSYISKYCEDQVVSNDNYTWFLTRIGYFIGELYVNAFDGCWDVDENPSSETFSCYVIKDFSMIDDQSKVVDPFAIAKIYVDTPAPRRLNKLYEESILGMEGPKFR